MVRKRRKQTVPSRAGYKPRVQSESLKAKPGDIFKCPPVTVLWALEINLKGFFSFSKAMTC